MADDVRVALVRALAAAISDGALPRLRFVSFTGRRVGRRGSGALGRAVRRQDLHVEARGR